MTGLLRKIYVYGMHKARRPLSTLGITAALEQHDTRLMHWLRSLLAIYDIDDMVRLDLAWWTFDALKEVKSFLAERSEARVFEWGSGASTIWLASRANQVISVEHDVRWANLVLKRVADCPNVQLRIVPPTKSGQITSDKNGFKNLFFDDYVTEIRKVSGQFDLIVIDGRAREACLDEALSRLAPGGMILFDDFNRKRYRIAVRSYDSLLLREKQGLAVSLPYPDNTALISLKPSS